MPSLRRLIDLPSVRDTPPDVLRWLRLVSPDLECYYWSGGVWWIGEVRPNTPRVHEARRLLIRYKAEGASLRRWVRAHLMAQGFSVLRMVSREPTSELALELGRLLWLSERELERDYQQQEAVADKSASRAQSKDWLRDYLEYQGRDTDRVLFRDRRSVTIDTPLSACRPALAAPAA